MNNVLIEFFDQDYLENIIASLDGSFNKVIFFYESQNKKFVEESSKYLKMFLYQKKKMSVEFRMIEPYDYTSVISSFDQLPMKNTNYVFDTTGGSNFFIAVAGYYAAHFPQENEIRIYDINKGICYSSKEEQKSRKITLPKLKVEEIIKIHNASVIKEPGNLIRYTINNADQKVLERLWKLASEDTAQWNKFMNNPRIIYPHKTINGKNAITRTDTVYNDDLACHNHVIKRLKEYGFVKFTKKTPCEEKKGAMEIKYDLFVPDSISSVFKQAGNLLELYTYAAADRCGCFNDVVTGVNLDWDTKENKSSDETSNEIDVIATAGCIPIVISCKNTNIIKEYLYELETVANHYCGKYSRKVIATSAKAPPVIRNRAKDMGIIVIDDLANTGFTKFQEKLKKNKPDTTISCLTPLYPGRHFLLIGAWQTMLIFINLVKLCCKSRNQYHLPSCSPAHPLSYFGNSAPCTRTGNPRRGQHRTQAHF